jgi:hypothetical protein
VPQGPPGHRVDAFHVRLLGLSDLRGKRLFIT